MATATAIAGGPESTGRPSSQRLSSSGTARNDAAYARSRTVFHDTPLRCRSASSSSRSRQAVNWGIRALGSMVRATMPRTTARRSALTGAEATGAAVVGAGAGGGCCGRRGSSGWGRRQASLDVGDPHQALGAGALDRGQVDAVLTGQRTGPGHRGGRAGRHGGLLRRCHVDRGWRVAGPATTSATAGAGPAIRSPKPPPSSSPSTQPMGAPTSAMPEGTAISTSVPATVLSTSMSTLSVITSQTTSPTEISSPISENQVDTSPSVIVIDILGMRIASRAIRTP